MLMDWDRSNIDHTVRNWALLDFVLGAAKRKNEEHFATMMQPVIEHNSPISLLIMFLRYASSAVIWQFDPTLTHVVSVVKTLWPFVILPQSLIAASECYGLLLRFCAFQAASDVLCHSLPLLELCDLISSALTVSLAKATSRCKVREKFINEDARNWLVSVTRFHGQQKESTVSKLIASGLAVLFPVELLKRDEVQDPMAMLGRIMFSFSDRLMTPSTSLRRPIQTVQHCLCLISHLPMPHLVQIHSEPLI